MTYAIGPKLGDFINGLVIPKYIHEMTGKKATIYICEQGCTFTKGIKQTYEDLLPIVTKQEYVENFLIHNREKIDYEVFKFRNSPLLFKDGWSKVYFSLLKATPPTNYKWLSYPTVPHGRVVVNRSVRNMSASTLTWYVRLLKEREVDFVFTDQAQYEAFPLKISSVYCPTLSSMVERIAGASLFIGNQSAPLAIASALNIPRIAELRRNPDAPHYLNDMIFNSNLMTFYGD